jgi:hypothetical protein
VTAVLGALGLDLAQPLHVAGHDSRGQVRLDAAACLTRAARERLAVAGLVHAAAHDALLDG